MNNLTVFNNENFGEVRVVTIENEPWFVGKDVADILGYSNTKDALAKRVDDEDKYQGDGVAICDPMGRTQHPTVINESGLYSLILSSKLPKAKEFKRWVTAEILPSIRKNGGYVNNEEQFADSFLPSGTPDEVRNFVVGCLKVMKDSKQVIKRQAEKIEEQNERIKALTPKASYYDVVLQCKDLLTITQIAKDFGMTAQALNEHLNIQHVQFRRGKQWYLYKEYDNGGYAQSSTYVYYSGETPHTSSLLKWTQKGRLMIYELLKKDGILPVCERVA